MSCRFELSELRCVDCGKRTGNLGTCADEDLCAECRKGFRDIGASRKEIAEMVVGMAEVAPLGYEEKQAAIDERQKRLMQKH